MTRHGTTTGARHYDVAAPGNWADHAQCAGANLALPHNELKQKHRGHNARRLIAHYCDRRPVLAECRAWALTYPDPAVGHVAGGMTPNERARARKAEL